MELKKAGERLLAGLWGKKATSLVFILGIAGILLIYLQGLIPWEKAGEEAAPRESAAPAEYRQRLEEDLCKVVRAVTGEENPQVMITLVDEGSYVYAADKKTRDGENSREEESAHVIIEDSGGAQQGLMLSRLRPEIKGVVIVSRGAGDPALREKLVNAARTALGVSSARVCVVESK